MPRRRLSFRDFMPLIGFVAPTLGIAYGFVIPGCIAASTSSRWDSQPRSPAPASATGWGCARSCAMQSRRDETPMKPGWIARQSRRPSGWLGGIVARLMARETRTANVFAAARGATPQCARDGCGSGQNLELLARRNGAGFVAGIDASDVMVRLATRRLRAQIEQGRVDVRRAEAAKLPFEPARFDAALAVHVLYFWPDAKVELREIRRVLRPGGVLVIGFRPDDLGARAGLPGSVYHLLRDGLETLRGRVGLTRCRGSGDALVSRARGPDLTGSSGSTAGCVAPGEGARTRGRGAPREHAA
jgi:SAM-dependent methyltransferase